MSIMRSTSAPIQTRFRTILMDKPPYQSGDGLRSRQGSVPLRTNPGASRGGGDCGQTSVRPLAKPRFRTDVRATSALSLPLRPNNPKHRPGGTCTFYSEQDDDDPSESVSCASESNSTCDRDKQVSHILADSSSSGNETKRSNFHFA